MGPTGSRWVPYWPHELCFLSSNAKSMAMSQPTSSNLRRTMLTSMRRSRLEYSLLSLLLMPWLLAVARTSAPMILTVWSRHLSYMRTGFNHLCHVSGGTIGTFYVYYEKNSTHRVKLSQLISSSGLRSRKFYEITREWSGSTRLCDFFIIIQSFSISIGKNWKLRRECSWWWLRSIQTSPWHILAFTRKSR